jgi:hypothetical protein
MTVLGANFLGKLGRLGNQMFQLAALKGIAENNGYQYCFPLTKDLYDGFNLSTISPLNLQLIDENRCIIPEETFHFNETLFNNCPDWGSLFGYFQSAKYFNHIKNEIRDDFSFKPEFLKPCVEFYDSLKYPISLHIRRTDYLTDNNHTTLPLEYYENALEEFEKTRPVLIFSDDIEWCKKQEIFKDDRFQFSESDNQYIDLCLMSLCSSHIIANSSFSWWGSYLANSQETIAPKIWFGPGNQHLETKDLYLEHWKVI